jgi:uncharacterized membrane protein (DUF373 family)
MLALSTAQTTIYSLCALVVVLGLLALLRVLLRREPSPPHWRRYRAGLFVERDPDREADETSENENER